MVFVDIPRAEEDVQEWAKCGTLQGLCRHHRAGSARLPEPLGRQRESGCVWGESLVMYVYMWCSACLSDTW